MPDTFSADDSGTRVSALDTSVIPLGERALRGVLDHVIAVGDEAETTYLEVKSALDMSTKVATAKIAKFLLGAANRRPTEASRHFHGHAVLVIGAQKDRAPGVPRGTEAHELEDRLRPYLGPQFPAFEFGRIIVDSDREVLFVIAQPPQEGQTIFPCHKNFQNNDRSDSLDDGAIYVRGTSNTRPARSGEVLALVERARGSGKPPINLEVQLIGRVYRVDRIDEVLEQLWAYREKEFTEESAVAQKSTFGPAPLGWASGPFGIPKPLSAEDRNVALAAWQSKKAQHITKGREHFLGAGLSGAGIRLVSRDRFIAKPHLTVVFHGCELLDHVDQDNADIEKVVEPVLRQQYPLGSPSELSTLRSFPRNHPVAWGNRDENAEVVLTPESFRPNSPWTTDQDDYVILTRDPEAMSVEVSWVVTEDGNDDVITGDFRVPTERGVDAAELFKLVFSHVD